MIYACTVKGLLSGLVNTPATPYMSIYLFSMRICKVYSLSNRVIATMIYIRSSVLNIRGKILKPFTYSFPWSPPSPWQPLFYFLCLWAYLVNPSKQQLFIYLKMFSRLSIPRSFRFFLHSNIVLNPSSQSGWVFLKIQHPKDDPIKQNHP